MAHIEYEVNLKIEDMSRATDEMLALPVKLSFVISVGYLRVKCDNVEEAEKYLNILRDEEVKEREAKGGERGKGKTVTRDNR
jgi:hypothetical protein